jgi:hypothetical protein
MIYHGTSTAMGLEPGDTILPPKGEREGVNSTEEDEGELVFLTPEKTHAGIYARRTARKIGGKPTIVVAIPSHPRQRVPVIPGATTIAAPAAYVISTID